MEYSRLRVAIVRSSVLLLTILLASSAFAQLHQESKENDTQSSAKKATASDKRGTDEVPFAIKMIPAPETKAQFEYEQKQREQQAITERDLADFTKWLVYATCLLAAVAIVQAGLFVWQLLLMRDGVKDAAIAAGAAQASADAAKASVVLAEKTAERQLRAYVCVTGTFIDMTDSSSPKAQVTVKNVGNTPAYNLRQWIHMWIEEYSVGFILPRANEDFGRSDAILGPGAEYVLFIPKVPNVPADAVHLLGTPQGTIFVYGRIEYRDAFGRDQWTNFRLIYGGENAMPPGAKNLKVDAIGNDAS